MMTTPQALGEVLTQNSYDYIKPAMLRNGIGRVLGVGLILAEGDEHKVSVSLRWLAVDLDECDTGAAQESHARVRLPSYQGPLSGVLDQILRDGQCLDG